MCAMRSSQSQSFHDEVVRIAAERMDREKWKIYTNPDGQKNVGIGDQYPDIILTPKNSNTVSIIVEVETEDSVTLLEGQTQWVQYSKMGGTFYLLVPKESVERAKQICSQLSISPKFAAFSVSSGQLSITYNLA